MCVCGGKFPIGNNKAFLCSRLGTHGTLVMPCRWIFGLMSVKTLNVYLGENFSRTRDYFALKTWNWKSFRCSAVIPSAPSQGGGRRVEESLYQLFVNMENQRNLSYGSYE